MITRSSGCFGGQAPPDIRQGGATAQICRRRRSGGYSAFEPGGAVLMVETIGERLNGLEAGDFVCTATRGGPLRASNFRRNVWVPAVEAAGIDPGLRMHDLRHTAASLMISSGASIKAVQRQLGHASAAMTLDLYGHLYDDDLEAPSTSATPQPARPIRGPRAAERSFRCDRNRPKALIRNASVPWARWDSNPQPSD